MHEDISDLIVGLEVLLQSKGLVKLQRACRGSVPTGRRRLVVIQPNELRQMIAVAIATADGLDELETIKGLAAVAGNPFHAIRQLMSAEAIQHLVSALTDGGSDESI